MSYISWQWRSQRYINIIGPKLLTNKVVVWSNMKSSAFSSIWFNTSTTHPPPKLLTGFGRISWPVPAWIGGGGQSTLDPGCANAGSLANVSWNCKAISIKTAKPKILKFNRIASKDCGCLANPFSSALANDYDGNFSHLFIQSWPTKTARRLLHVIIERFDVNRSFGGLSKRTILMSWTESARWVTAWQFVLDQGLTRRTRL